MTTADDQPETPEDAVRTADGPWPEPRVENWWHLPFPERLLATPAYDDLADLWEVPRLRAVATRLSTRSSSAPDRLLRRIDAAGSTVIDDPDTTLAAAARAARPDGPTELFTWHGLGLGFVANPHTAARTGTPRRRHIPGPLLLLRADQYEVSASLSPYRLSEPGYVRREVDDAIRSIDANRWTPRTPMPDIDPPEHPPPPTDLDADPRALELVKVHADPQHARPCLYGTDGRCATHGRRELFGVCQTTVARELLRRHGHLPLTAPAAPMTVLAHRLRTAAVAVELAMTPSERGRMRWEYLEEASPGFDDRPVCALITAAVAHHPLDWLLPEHHGHPARDFRVRWPAFAAAYLSDQLYPAAWRLAAVIGAAFLAGHTPQVDDVLDLARRAAGALRTRADSDEAIRLFLAYDRLAASEIPRPGAHNTELNHLLDLRAGTTNTAGETSP